MAFFGRQKRLVQQFDRVRTQTKRDDLSHAASLPEHPPAPG
jgi:hypothetical protein